MVGVSLVLTWSTVTEAAPAIAESIVNGVPQKRDVIVITCTGKYGICRMQVSPDTVIRKGFDALTKSEQFARALAYQASLDNKGRPLRKAA